MNNLENKELKEVTGSEGGANRRQFLKNVGKFVFSLTLLSQAKSALACCSPGCDGTYPDCTCDSAGESDGTCGVICGDTDGGCGSGNTDNHCGYSGDTDDNCGPPCSDSFDSDGSCNMGGNETDNSCGDCDDIHNTDDNCAVPEPGGDPDNLCGHPHYFGGDEDNNCTASHGPDSFCGTYNFDYQTGGPWTDTDQHCGVDGDSDNSSDDRTAGCTNDTNKPEWHYSGS